MTPYRYPKTKHRRKQAPGSLSNYRNYKPYLRAEFERKCVYCRTPDTLKDEEMFGVDHYRPKKKFPQLLLDYSNLYYCCNPCNRRKHEYWPERGYLKTRFVPNPCDHVMFDHMRFVDNRVESRTEAGRHTVDLLDLNDPQAIELRKFHNHLLESERGLLAEVEAMRQALRGAPESGPEIATAVATLDTRAAQLRSAIDRIMGD